MYYPFPDLLLSELDLRIVKPSQLFTITNLLPKNVGNWPGGGGGYSHTLPIRVCAAQRGRDFEAPDLERGIHFRGVF